jgi:hypothetical protein
MKMDRTLFAALSARINSTRHLYVGKPAVNTLWAIARMQLRREIGLIHGLVTQIHERLECLAPMDVGMVLWVRSMFCPFDGVLATLFVSPALVSAFWL